MLDRYSSLPLHIQFETIIRQKIENEDWPLNSCIPSENELTKEYGISRMTVRAVLNRLVQEGLIYRSQGKGTFVAEPKIISAPLVRYGIREQLEQMGYETVTKVLSIEKTPVSLKYAKILNLKRGSNVYAVKRVRYLKNEPLSYHISYIPVSFFPRLEKQDMEHCQLCTIMEKNYHFVISRRLETLEAVTASSEESLYLSVKPNFPLLQLENTVYTEKDLPIEYSRITFRGDKIKIKFEYQKP
jgi:GntR family transcriptional regulator